MDRKIALVGWGYPPHIDGGLDIHVKELFIGLKERGVDVELFLPEENAPDMEEVTGLETGEGDMIQMARKMSAEIAAKSEAYDLIHTHDWFGAEAGYKCKKYGDMKWVSTMHSLSSSRNRNTHSEVERLEKVAVKKSDVALAVSSKLASEIEEEYSDRPQVIRNGFSEASETGRDVKEDLGIDEDMIFFVGRHAEQKGLKHLIYGFKKYIEENEAALVIGGSGHMTEGLKEFAEILGIEEKVFFTGFIPEDELGDYYQSADLFVSPSINEPFGLTITEALNAGTPVAATDNGVKELISEEYITSIDPDSDSICEGISKGLEKDFSELKNTRSWDNMVDELMDVYRDL